MPALVAVPRANQKLGRGMACRQAAALQGGGIVGPALVAVPRANQKMACLCVRPALVAVPRANRNMGCLGVRPALVAGPRANQKLGWGMACRQAAALQGGGIVEPALVAAPRANRKTACLCVGPALAAAPRANRKTACPCVGPALVAVPRANQKLGWGTACRQAAALQRGGIVEPALDAAPSAPRLCAQLNRCERGQCPMEHGRRSPTGCQMIPFTADHAVAWM